MHPDSKQVAVQKLHLNINAVFESAAMNAQFKLRASVVKHSPNGPLNVDHTVDRGEEVQRGGKGTQ
jgi:hypothetical protein